MPRLAGPRRQRADLARRGALLAAVRHRGRDLEAVCVDGYGTLLRLDDPGPALVRALAAAGVESDEEAVARAFRAEVAHYRPRSLEGRDAETLAALRRDCCGVFLRALPCELDEGEFVHAFVGSLRFHLTDGALEALDRLRGAGLRLACVANWDVGLHEWLDRLGARDRFETVVTSADAGFEKPDPRIFRVALERLGVEPAHALHVGDEPVDRDGAAAAGLLYEEVPLSTLPDRLGL